jgi:hypothetical protein
MDGDVESGLYILWIEPRELADALNVGDKRKDKISNTYSEA